MTSESLAGRHFRIPSAGGSLACYALGERSQDGPVVVFSHGLTNDHSDAPLFASLATRLVGLGVTVVMFDYFGSGASPGQFRDKTLTKLRTNLGDVVNAVKRGGYGDRMGLFGRSVGGTMCAFFARDPAVSCTVLASVPFDLNAAFGPLRGASSAAHVRLPKDTHPPSGQLKGPYELSQEFFDELPSLTADLHASLRGAPRVLVLHGSADAKVETTHAAQLLGILGHDSDGITITGAGHNYEGDEHEVVELATDWFMRWLSEGAR